MSTTIFVDADACPVRDEIHRVATRVGVAVVLVSNGSRPIRPTGLPNVTAVVVEAGADVADDWIVAHAGAGDVCVTADIPLAARCLDRGAACLSPKGHRWTADNIGGALAGRDVARHLREIGVATGGPSPLTRADRAAFLVSLDAVLAAARRPRADTSRALPSFFD